MSRTRVVATVGPSTVDEDALARRSREVHVLMNNCYREYAVQSAKQLAALLS